MARTASYTSRRPDISLFAWRAISGLWTSVCMGRRWDVLGRFEMGTSPQTAGIFRANGNKAAAPYWIGET